MIAVDHIDMDEPHVQALVASLFKVFLSQYDASNMAVESLHAQFMDLNNDKHVDFNEFSKILMGSMRADYRLRALFTFYVYDEGQKGFTSNHTVRFIEAQ